MKKVFLLCVLTVYGQANAERLIWADEFNSGAQPNPEFWSYDVGRAHGWGHGEAQAYTKDFANVGIDHEAGLLRITALEQKLPDGSRTFTSGRIKTQGKLTFQYGTIEARIKMPDLADGLWPAFWTLGSSYKEVGWPACGELDIVEMGSVKAIADGVINRRVESNSHRLQEGVREVNGMTFDVAEPLHEGFHIYRMEWTPRQVSTYLDQQLIWEMGISPDVCRDCSAFHQPHFIILNMAVGGSFTGIYRAGITADFPAALEVDWVRVYDNGFSKLAGTALPVEKAGIK